MVATLDAEGRNGMTLCWLLSVFQIPRFHGLLFGINELRSGERKLKTTGDTVLSLWARICEAESRGHSH
jgi:hypothetical protein